MDAILGPAAGFGIDDLLLQTSETMLQMAGIARNNETDDETKIFYSHLESHCLRLRDCARQVSQTPFRLDGDLVNQTLSHLGSLVPESHLQALPRYMLSAPLHSRLRTLSFHWNEVRKQHHQAKLDFISQWLRPPASEDHRSEMDKALEHCVDHMDKQQPEQSLKPPMNYSTSLRIGEPSYVVWRAAQSVFDALLACSGCSCPSQHDFGAKLELGTYRRSAKKADEARPVKSIKGRLQRSRGDDDAAGNLDFDLFLSMEQDWQEVRVQTVKEKGVGFSLPGDVMVSRPSSAPSEYAKVESICRQISNTKARALQRLVLKLASDRLFEMGFEKSNFHVDNAVNPISLTRCFEERHDFFTEKTKRILSLIIGYAVLHLSGTSWLQPGWGSASIKFFQTTSSKTPLRPFIQTQFPQTGPIGSPPDFGVVVDGGDGEGDAFYNVDLGHKCPTLIALAVVLMEIYFVKPFKKLAEMHGVELIGGHNNRIALIDVDQVFNGDEESEREGWRLQIPEDSAFLTAIDNCLDVELWRDEKDRALGSAALRSQIYQQVLRPLELHLFHGFSQIPLDGVDNYARNLDFGKYSQVIVSQEPDGKPHPLTAGLEKPSQLLPLALVSGASNQAEAPLMNAEFWEYVRQCSQFQSLDSYGMPVLDFASKSGMDYKSSQFFDDEMGNRNSSFTETKRYLNWRSNYEKVYEKFVQRHLPKFASNPVKIAILDTGIDRDHYVFEAREEQLKGRHNCYNDSQKSVPDKNGHGTFTASLILDYAPDAMLYVIKIADRENARPDAKIVVNAINHAVDKWDVDIISMSFGWPSSDFDGYDALQAAIDKAYSKNILMFAAAANSGGRLGRAYPASSSHVICVHSTNAYGSASDFSPTAEPNAINIATVGESVQSAWPMLLCRDRANSQCIESRSGTSYATPIVAGIAAFLLQYVRLHLPTHSRTLKRKEKMEALLRRCAQRGPNYMPRDGYHYVEMSLDKHNLFGEELPGVNYEVTKAMKT